MGIRGRFSQFRERLPGGRDATEAAPGEAEPAEPGGSLRPRLVVGLGNPGAKYARNRHNVGAWVVEELARRHGGRFEAAGRVERAEVNVQGKPLTLARARAFYNESGPAVAAEVKRLRMRPSALLVVYDELDLPVGRVRLRLQGSHGGNNGMRSIIGALRSNEFPRIRIGIDRPYDAGAPVRDPDRIAAWVLSNPSPDDREALEAAVRLVADAIEVAVDEGIEVAMNRYNRSPGPA